jgi:hypothetical protein
MFRFKKKTLLKKNNAQIHLLNKTKQGASKNSFLHIKKLFYNNKLKSKTKIDSGSWVKPEPSVYL